MAKKSTTKKSQGTEEPKEKSLGPFDFINSITKTKEELIRGSENEELAEKSYNAFLTNRALSFHLDTVLYANEMNTRGGSDNIFQYDYLMGSVRKMNRKHFWPKKSVDDDVETVSQYYKVNPRRAREIASMLTDDQISRIRAELQTGGPVKSHK